MYASKLTTAVISVTESKISISLIMSTDEVDDALYMVSFIVSAREYIGGVQSEKFLLLMGIPLINWNVK